MHWKIEEDNDYESVSVFVCRSIETIDEWPDYVLVLKFSTWNYFPARVKIESVPKEDTRKQKNKKDKVVFSCSTRVYVLNFFGLVWSSFKFDIFKKTRINWTHTYRL